MTSCDPRTRVTSCDTTTSVVTSCDPTTGDREETRQLRVDRAQRAARP